VTVAARTLDQNPPGLGLFIWPIIITVAVALPIRFVLIFVATPDSLIAPMIRPRLSRRQKNGNKHWPSA
jgi:hypothetical protein